MATTVACGLAWQRETYHERQKWGDCKHSIPRIAFVNDRLLLLNKISIVQKLLRHEKKEFILAFSFRGVVWGC